MTAYDRAVALAAKLPPEQAAVYRRLARTLARLEGRPLLQVVTVDDGDD